jgi:mannose-6-phosphate isomerase
LGAHRLASRHVERIWGRRDLAGPFAPPAGDAGEPIGEIWFESAGGSDLGAELLVKYLFTAERLSIQVHPGDAAARAAGHARGKDEAWYVLSAEPGAVIGLGLTHQVSREALRVAALDGSIERLLDWRPAQAGDVYYSPAGTIHAIGGGLSLIEIQQNLDLTYRLYDYGRPRELHLDEGVAVADPAPWAQPFAPVRDGPRTLLAAGQAFVLERWSTAGDAAADLPRGSLLIPLAPGGGTIDGVAAEAGTVWAAAGRVALGGAIDLLLAYPGREALRPSSVEFS